MTIFEETGGGMLMTKINITFSMGNGLPNTVFKFFPQKHLYRLNESQKTYFGAYFLHASGSFVPLFSRPIRFIHGWTRTNQLNLMKIGSKLRPVLCILVHKYGDGQKSGNWFACMQNKQKELQKKRKTWY